MIAYTDTDYARILLQDWQDSVAALLSQYPRSHLDGMMPDIAAEFLDSSVLDVEGATDDEIAEAEQRIGLALPPDYAAFLRCSNQLIAIGLEGADERFLSVDEVDLYSRLYCESYRAYMDDDMSNFSEADDLTGGRQIAVHGPEQLPELVYFPHLPECIAISTREGSGSYVLNPNVRNGNKYEAWLLDYRLPGALRFPSFFALIEYEIVRSVAGLENSLGSHDR